MNPAKAKARLGRDDWAQAAVVAIGEGGLAAVAVEPLARKLGVTKGSFYSHFKNRDELIDAALERWEQMHGAEGTAALVDIADPAERLRAIIKTGLEFSETAVASPHIALLGEMHDARVRPVVKRVSDARQDYLASVYEEIGFSKPRARARARLLYSTYVGSLQLGREDPTSRLSPKHRRELIAEFERTLVVD
jgi:AcrR family transcriptional regulator